MLGRASMLAALLSVFHALLLVAVREQLLL